MLYKKRRRRVPHHHYCFRCKSFHSGERHERHEVASCMQEGDAAVEVLKQTVLLITPTLLQFCNQASMNRVVHSGGIGVSQPVVATKQVEHEVPLLVEVTKAFLLLVSWGVTIWWITIWYLLPTEKYDTLKETVSVATESNFLGRYAKYYVMFVSPVILLAILALLYLELEARFPKRVRCSSREQPRLVRLYRAIWTQPIFVKTPIGIITFIDIVIIVIVFVCTLWIWIEKLIPKLAEVDADEPEDGEPKWALKWEKTCEMSGRALPYIVAVLFLPVSRGSPILRLINVPFEQAIKYHRWFGYLTVALSFVHGATYGVYAGAIHKLELFFEWPLRGISNFAGLISVVAAIIIGFTSIPYFRLRHFNTFFAMHQLYLVFFAFYVYHVDWNHAGASMGPIFLFFIDRFLRLMQSRRQVSGVSARVLSSGLVELKIPKQPGFKYNTLSFLYLNVPGLSKLQWHPFSNSSSPLDDNDKVSVLIKPLGDWTAGLHNEVNNKFANTTKLSGCPFAMKLYAEGPYGHERDYFLRYRRLILVAGGAGVTPFMAIIEDLLKRHFLQQDGLPMNVQLIWCVRGRAELATLRTIKPGKLCPSYGYQHFNSFDLTLKAYVTGEAKTGGQSIELPMVEMSGGEIQDFGGDKSPQKGAAHHRGVSTINSYQNLWMIALILVSMTGFVLMSALFYHFVTDPDLQPEGKIFSASIETTLHFVSIFVGVVICGGSVIFLWMSNAKSGVASAGFGQESKVADPEGNHDSTLLDNCLITVGSRPQFKELFDEFAEKHDGQEVGVLVCGPQGLQESVAAACRSQNFASLMKTPFHYHSVSFDL